MCTGISISRRDIPDVLVERYRLQRRIVTRSLNVEPEVRFLYRDPSPLLPVCRGSEFVLYPWGNKNRSRLPRGGWCQLDWLEAGTWAHLHPEPVEIPAMLGLERGVWFHIHEGVKGVVVHDEQGQERVYMLTQPASHYYQVMTRNERMPVFVGAQM
jgi:hypothetical protein